MRMVEYLALWLAPVAAEKASAPETFPEAPKCSAVADGELRVALCGRTDGRGRPLYLAMGPAQAHVRLWLVHAHSSRRAALLECWDAGAPDERHFLAPADGVALHAVAVAQRRSEAPRLSSRVAGILTLAAGDAPVLELHIFGSSGSEKGHAQALERWARAFNAAAGPMPEGTLAVLGDRLVALGRPARASPATLWRTAAQSPERVSSLAASASAALDASLLGSTVSWARLEALDRALISGCSVPLGDPEPFNSLEVAATVRQIFFNPPEDAGNLGDASNVYIQRLAQQVDDLEQQLLGEYSRQCGIGLS